MQSRPKHQVFVAVFLTRASLIAALAFLAGCGDNFNSKNGCTAKGQICCQVTTGAGVAPVEKCVAQEEQCADLANRSPQNPPYPKYTTTKAKGACS